MKLTFSRGHYYKHADREDFFWFKYPVTCKKLFPNSHNLIEINVNVVFYVLNL